MKEKRTYSLTAKERKQKRMKSEAPARETTEQTEVKTAEAAAETEAQKPSPVFLAIVISVAAVLILTGVLVPVITYLVNPYRGYSDVIARFKLSNGMTLEYVIDEDQFDTACTNFIFLATNGYFDNTVLFDAQNGWVRFGGYDEQPSVVPGSTNDYNRTHHRAQSEEYCKNFTALPNEKFDKVLNKFGYKLRADKGGETPSLIEEIGSLTYLYSDTSTEFQFAYKKGATDNITRISSDGKPSSDTLEATMVGHALNDETIENLKKIAETAAKNDSITFGFQWTPPTPDIRINSVKIYNLDKEKWKDFNFIDYMNGEDSAGRRRLSGWTGQV